MDDRDGPSVVRVDPERLSGWLDRYAATHGEPTLTLSSTELILDSPDTAQARIRLIWGSLDDAVDPIAALLASVSRPRIVAALLVRASAHAVGVFEGTRLLASHVETHYVQGRTKAGGWSQQRYARRRAHQHDRAREAAVEDAARLLLPEIGRLTALLCGGDGASVNQVLADPRLSQLGQLPRHGREVFAVPDPRRAVLDDFPRLFRAVPIELNPQARHRGSE